MIHETLNAKPFGEGKKILKRKVSLSTLLFMTVAALGFGACAVRHEAVQGQAEEILRACDFSGGLIVHLGPKPAWFF